MHFLKKKKDEPEPEAIEPSEEQEAEPEPTLDDVLLKYDTLLQRVNKLDEYITKIGNNLAFLIDGLYEYSTHIVPINKYVMALQELLKSLK